MLFVCVWSQSSPITGSFHLIFICRLSDGQQVGAAYRTGLTLMKGFAMWRGGAEEGTSAPPAQSRSRVSGAVDELVFQPALLPWPAVGSQNAPGGS